MPGLLWLVAMGPIAAGAQAPAPSPELKDLDALLKTLPAASAPALDEARAHWLLAGPLACLDQLQPRPTSRPYFWEATFKPVDGYDKVRAFYGCSDWHSAVNATWTFVKLLKQFPQLPENQLVREKLNDHLGKSNFEGELAFFKDAPTFERPYGQAWLLRLYAELATWDDPQAEQWTANVAPLAKFLSEKLVEYLKNLDLVNRTGGQTNTAQSLGLMLDAIEVSRDYALKTAVGDVARKFYGKDTDCATDAETTASDIASPCLAEAALMSRVLDQPSFVAWLDRFLPAANSTKFKPLTTIVIDLTAGARAGQPGRGRAGGAAGAAASTPPPASPPQAQTASAQTATAPAPARGGGGRGPGAAAAGSRVNPIALAFTRADAFRRLADALPATDTRVAVFQRLADIHGERAAAALSDPAVVDAPWLGAYAISSMRKAK